jgi:tetratricopeptide (TPR) repeat protein
VTCRRQQWVAARLVMTSLLFSLALPCLALAGGDSGQDAYDVGEKLFARKHYRTALKYYEKALKQDDLRAHYRMGLAYEELGRDQDARYHYQLFVDLAPQDARHGDASQHGREARSHMVPPAAKRPTDGAAPSAQKMGSSTTASASPAAGGRSVTRDPRRIGMGRFIPMRPPAA